jgi:hypothetical protein
MSAQPVPEIDLERFRPEAKRALEDAGFAVELLDGLRCWVDVDTDEVGTAR